MAKALTTTTSDTNDDYDLDESEDNDIKSGSDKYSKAGTRRNY